MISFLSVFPPYRGGIATFSDYLYKNLKNKYSVKAYNFSKLYPSLLFPGKSQKTDLPEKQYAEPVLNSMNPLNWAQAGRTLAVSDPEILLYSFWHPFFAPSFWLTLKTLKKRRPLVKRIGIVHNVLPHEYFPFQKFLTIHLFKQTDHIILLSGQSVSEFKKLSINTPFKKLFHPVYNQPLPLESKAALRARYNLPVENTIFIFFGLIRDYKGLDIFIRALNRLHLNTLNITPLIVGEFYTDKEKLLNLIKPRHRQHYTIIDRFVSRKEMGEFLSLSDAMVMPYRTATQSGVLSNALNFNLPVITSDLPGLTEHIEHNRNGLIFPSGDDRKMAEMIHKMLDNTIRSSMAGEMKATQKKLSWQQFIEELFQAF